MAKIKTFRITGNPARQDAVEFYIKVTGDDDSVMLNLALDGDGVYYYRRGSQILTPREHKGTMNTYDGFLSMDTLHSIFEELSKIGWNRRKEERQAITVQRERRRIILTIEETAE